MRWHCTGIFWQDKIDLFFLLHRGEGGNWIKNKVLQKSECTTNETLVLPTKKYPSLTLQPLPVIQIFPHLPLRLMEWFHLNFLNIISLSSVIKLKGRKNLIISCVFLWKFKFNTIGDLVFLLNVPFVWSKPSWELSWRCLFV